VILRPAPLAGALVVEIEPHGDERGFFARTWCRDEFARAGVEIQMVQASVSHNRERGTLRGMHFQWPPSREAKLIRCQQGEMHDVLLDLRPDSPTYLQHFALTLSAAAHNALYCPPGVAHGFQTLAPDTIVYYMMSDVYRPDLYGGVRHDDPAFGIAWPLPPAAIHERDAAYPDFDRGRHAREFASRTGAGA
jgi:dTDP-4-dehydrorhamnose 3,5-epimerase